MTDPTRPFDVCSSELHGLGLFATVSLAAGDLIGTAEGTPTRRDGPHVLWFVDEDGSEEGLRITNDLRYVNHATDANAAFDGEQLLASRAIAVDEEITIDYGVLDVEDLEQASTLGGG